MSLEPGFKDSKVSEHPIKSGSFFQTMGDVHAKDLSPLVEVLDLNRQIDGP